MIYNVTLVSGVQHSDSDKYICMYIHIYTHIYMCVCIYIHTHIHTHNGILPIKKNEALPFAATRMDLENIILSEVCQTKTNIYIWNLKNSTNEFIYKTETDSQT